MELKPRRGRLRVWWAGLLAALVSRGGGASWVLRRAAALVSRGGAWARRAAAALRHRLARRPAAALHVARTARGSGESATATTTSGPPSPTPQPQEDRRGRTPSPRARRVSDDRAHDDTASSPGSPSAPPQEEPDPDPNSSPASAQEDSVEGDDLGRATTPTSRGGNTSSDEEGRREDGDESPRAAAALVAATAAQQARTPSPRASPPVLEDEDPEHGGARNAATTSIPGEHSELPLAAAAAADLNAEKAEQRGVGKDAEEEVRDLGDARNAASATIPGDSSGVCDATTALGPGEHNPAAQEGTRRERVKGINIGSVENTCRANPSAPRDAALGKKNLNSNAVATPASPEGRAPSPRAARGRSPEEHGESSNAASTTIPGDNSEHPLAGQAAELHRADGVAHGGERTEPGQAEQDPQEGPAARHDALNAQPGAADADAVHAQPDLAAAPPAGRSGSRARRGRRMVPGNNKKIKAAAAPRQDQPLLQWEEDEATEEEVDQELQKHQTYRDKAAAVCRKNYIYCLICHLNNKEKKLEKDEDEIKHHFNTEHQCGKAGGILCQKKGCFVRAKYNRDIGLHEYVCHKLS